MPRIICCIAMASADGWYFLSLSPLAAALSGNMRKVEFMTIWATRGTSACISSPVIPNLVAIRTGFSTQASAIMFAASSGESTGTLS